MRNKIAAPKKIRQSHRQYKQNDCSTIFSVTDYKQHKIDTNCMCDFYDDYAEDDIKTASPQRADVLLSIRKMLQVDAQRWCYVHGEQDGTPEGS